MSCRLCGLDSGAAAFCCAGCENVYAILLESGVLATGQNFRETALFQESLRLGLVSKPAAARPALPANAETREAVFQLGGLWCASCGWLIEHALAQIYGVVSAEVYFTSDLLKVRYAPQYLPVSRIGERVAALGYRIHDNRTASVAERNDLLLRTGIAAFLWVNVMTLSVVIYASYFESIAASFARWLPLLLMALATPAVFYCAFPILRIAWAGARHGVLRMETLLAAGILTVYVYSAQQALAGGGRVYFDTACAIVTLVLAGKSIERAAKEKTSSAMTLLYRLMPAKARLLETGRERFVSIEALHAGGIFRVKAGERIPADGVVREGRSHADESVLTGESAPRPKTPGDVVVSGSMNLDGVLDIEATRVGVESTLSQIVRTVEQAMARRTGIERAVDRVSRHFIPAVLAIAVLTGAAFGLMRAIAVVVIACPCALGIATPLALSAAVSRASRRGILVADTRALETIRDVNVVVLDKTGTATFGEFTLLRTEGDTSRMRELAALEQYATHPIGKALCAAAGHGLPAAQDVKLHPGAGITGTIDGTPYFVGNERLVRNECGTAPDHGHSVHFGWDGVVRGSLSFGDRVRPEAAVLCADLRARGIRTVLLSGDGRGAVEAAAREIGVDEWIAEADPERKVAYIRELQERGARVAMVGDGVNDAPSLAQADLGIAMGAGADIAMQAAPLVLMGNRLEAVSETLDLARRTFRVVRQNLFWAFAYNTAGITLAVAGVLSPIMAAGAMVLSSVSVIANSRR
jgi:heavy metal translocating P-type ATPase